MRRYPTGLILPHPTCIGYRTEVLLAGGQASCGWVNGRMSSLQLT
jgi:hypothetical protein